MRVLLVIALLGTAAPAGACPTDPEEIELAILGRQIRSLRVVGGRTHRFVDPPPAEMWTRVEALQRRRREPRAPLVGGLVDGPALGQLVARVSAARLSAPMLRVLEEEAAHRWFCAAHAQRILSLFSYDDDRMAALARLSGRIIDDEPAALLEPLFSQRQQREKIRAFFAR